jgi:hypothetical protein
MWQQENKDILKESDGFQQEPGELRLDSNHP